MKKESKELVLKTIHLIRSTKNRKKTSIFLNSSEQNFIIPLGKPILGNDEYKLIFNNNDNSFVIINSFGGIIFKTILDNDCLDEMVNLVDELISTKDDKEVLDKFNQYLYSMDVDRNELPEYLQKFDVRVKTHKQYLKELIGDVNDLEKITSSKFPNRIFWRKNGNVILEYNIKDGWFYVDYDAVWKKIKEKYSISDDSICEILGGLLRETFKLKVTETHQYFMVYDNQRWGNLSN